MPVVIPALIAHLLFALLILTPWQSIRAIRHLDVQVRTNPRARIEFYRMAILGQWVLVPAALVATWSAGPSLAAIGLVLPVIDVERLALLALVAALVLTQSPLLPPVRRRMLRSQGARRAAWPLRNVLPRSDEEKRRWVGVALTAGICEEVLFRGFLFHYFGSMLGFGLYATVALSSALFGMSHYYQGPANMLRVAAVGALLGIAYAATGSLFFPAVLHILLDLGALYMDALVPDDREATPRDSAP